MAGQGSRKKAPAKDKNVLSDSDDGAKKREKEEKARKAKERKDAVEETKRYTKDISVYGNSTLLADRATFEYQNNALILLHYIAIVLQCILLAIGTIAGRRFALPRLQPFMATPARAEYQRQSRLSDGLHGLLKAPPFAVPSVDATNTGTLLDDSATTAPLDGDYAPPTSAATAPMTEKAKHQVGKTHDRLKMARVAQEKEKEKVKSRDKSKDKSKDKGKTSKTHAAKDADSEDSNTESSSDTQSDDTQSDDTQSDDTHTTGSSFTPPKKHKKKNSKRKNKKRKSGSVSKATRKSKRDRKAVESSGDDSQIKKKHRK